MKKRLNLVQYIWMLAIILAPFQTLAAEPFWLITDQESQLVSMPDDRWDSVAKAITGSGPSIVVHEPKALDKVQVPIDILVTFEPGEAGVDPDMGSFKATLIGFFDIDITSRVREHIHGNRLDVKDAKLPKGNHRIRISIQDLDGNINERDMHIHIVAP